MKPHRLRIFEYESLSTPVRPVCWAIDRLGWAWRNLFPIRHSVELRDARQILVARLDGLGDLTVSIPTLPALRRARPETRIVLLVPAGWPEREGEGSNAHLAEPHSASPDVPRLRGSVALP